MITMHVKGDIIYGEFNYPIGNSYFACTAIESNGLTEYIKHVDIKEYKIKLFEDNTNIDIFDMIDVMEALNNEKEYFNYKDFHNVAKDFDLILLNQKLITGLISNDCSNFVFKYLEGIQIKDKLIPIKIIPKDNVVIYLLKLDSEQKITSYKKLLK